MARLRGDPFQSGVG